jgi:tRNA (cmo5U34)-methyltransferase
MNVWGVDNSDAMLKHSTVRENLIKSDTFPKENGPFDAIIANWTLHFIEEKKREAYLKDIYDSMNKGGVFIISDKMAGSDVSQRGYIDFKRAQGLSEEAIARKTTAVTGVLIPLPMQWYLEKLDRIGFKHIEVIDALWRFNTILARK